MRLNKHSQSGSAIIYVLIGVVLFSMLMYSILKGGSTSSGIASKGNAKNSASAIIIYSNRIKTAVDQLLAKGCSETQLGFNNVDNIQNNPNSLSDNSCQVFNSKGGNVTFAKASTFGSNGYQYTGNCDVTGSLSTNADITFAMTGLTRETCIEINKTLGVAMTGGEPSVLTYGCNHSGWNGAFNKMGTVPTSSRILFCARGPTGTGASGILPSNSYGLINVLVSR